MLFFIWIGNHLRESNHLSTYLGINLTETLIYIVSSLLTSLCAKAHQVLGLLYRRFYTYCDLATLLLLYRSLVHPRLEYTCPVWSPHTTKSINQLECVQKFGLKLVTHKWKANYNDLLNNIDIPSL